MTNAEKINVLLNRAAQYVARAAAISEIASYNEADTLHRDISVILYRDLRSLCNEFGFNYESKVDSARRIAPNIINDSVNVL